MLFGRLILILLVIAGLQAGPLAAQNTGDSLPPNDVTFGVNLYKLVADKPGNLFFSPLSFTTALAMTQTGARGVTEKEMSTAACLPYDAPKILQLFGDLLKKLNTSDGKNELRLANSLWAQKDYTFLPEFMKPLQEAFSARVENLDFKADAEAARKVINTWVAEQTRDRIKELLPERSLDSLTRLVLVNAVYFKGAWEVAFEEDRTVPQPFFVDGKDGVEVPLMFQKGHFGYAVGNGFQVLEIPYVGNRLGMVIFLPDAKDGLAAFEKEMTGPGLSKMIGQLKPIKEIQLFLPKVIFSWGGAMKEHLQALGMKVPFEDNADFSGMTGKPDLKIDQVYHQAFVEVNEAGTEAAAATAVVMSEKGISMDFDKPKVFKADHPFLFLIRERETGTVLFLGRVTDPRSK